DVCSSDLGQLTWPLEQYRLLVQQRKLKNLTTFLLTRVVSLSTSRFRMDIRVTSQYGICRAVKWREYPVMAEASTELKSAIFRQAFISFNYNSTGKTGLRKLSKTADSP